MDKRLSTDPYKGTRDFYPEDMAIQRYIFDTWSKTAELFGFERYDASILEPAELYKVKGAENAELISEQTYTFLDRGEREVTLRPEMTPTVARMVAARRRELSFPVRWYSIPNLFRYERPQRGRLREHWQLNCDMFGVEDVASDVEMISLAYHTLIAFGATPDMFEIRVNDRTWIKYQLSEYGLGEEETKAILTLIDKREKIDNFAEEAEKIAGRKVDIDFTAPSEDIRLMEVVRGLEKLGIRNVVVSPSTVRGFEYYTGTIFEIFDTAKDNRRSLLGGGRYDNLTGLFGGDPISGVGFGMGDVTVRDFLETHKLIPKEISVTAPSLVVIPTEPAHNLEAERVAQEFRNAGTSTSVDLTDRKVGRKIGDASDAGAQHILVIGTDELASGKFTLKNLASGEEAKGSVEELTKHLV